MADLPYPLTCPRHVRAVDFGHVLVLVDYRTGAVRCLLPAASLSWRTAARTGRLDQMEPALARRLVTLGLLVPSDALTPWADPVKGEVPQASWGSAEHSAGIVCPARTAPTPTVGAAACLSAVFVAGRFGGMRSVVGLLRRAASTCERPATPEQALAAVQAVRRAGWYSPGRTVCLEESAAALLLLAARRRAVRWCHGVAPDPVRLHAWVQTVDGAHVAEPLATRDCTILLTVGGPSSVPSLIRSCG